MAIIELSLWQALGSYFLGEIGNVRQETRWRQEAIGFVALVLSTPQSLRTPIFLGKNPRSSYVQRDWFQSLCTSFDLTKSPRSIYGQRFGLKTMCFFSFGTFYTPAIENPWLIHGCVAFKVKIHQLRAQFNGTPQSHDAWIRD